jgi:hypothetical protein
MVVNRRRRIPPTGKKDPPVPLELGDPLASETQRAGNGSDRQPVAVAQLKDAADPLRNPIWHAHHLRRCLSSPPQPHRSHGSPKAGEPTFGQAQPSGAQSGRGTPVGCVIRPDRPSATRPIPVTNSKPSTRDTRRKPAWLRRTTPVTNPNPIPKTPVMHQGVMQRNHRSCARGAPGPHRRQRIETLVRGTL